MTKQELTERITNVRAIIKTLTAELHRLEAIYIEDLHKMCHHEIDESKWFSRRVGDNFEVNSCKICGATVKREKPE